MPGAPKIDPNATTDALEKLVQSVTKKVPVARIDANSSPLDTSKMDMEMTVEVENELYTPPPPETTITPPYRRRQAGAICRDSQLLIQESPLGGADT